MEELMNIDDVYDTLSLCAKILNKPDTSVELVIQEVRLRIEEILTMWAIAHNECIINNHHE
jgi:hypothetical protein|tara:strand:+ start:195 stop:377 length:183 start_codon:yes stop_codon:yes gene_type:complete